jgi:uncharacterized protein (TIGR02996 family)
LWYDVTIKRPHDSRGLLNYAVQQIGQGRFERAITYLEAARRESLPNLGLIEANLAVASAGLERSADTERHFRTAIALLPGDERCRTFYADWLAKQGREKEAIEQLGMAIRVNPDALGSIYLLIKIYAKRGSWAAVERTAEWLLDRLPGEDNARAFLLMAAEAGQSGGKRPLNILRTPENYVNLSALYYEAKNYTNAVAAAEQALIRRPGYADAYDNLAASYRAAGDCVKAEAAAREALKIRPGDGVARRALTGCQSASPTIF